MFSYESKDEALKALVNMVRMISNHYTTRVFNMDTREQEYVPSAKSTRNGVPALAHAMPDLDNGVHYLVEQVNEMTWPHVIMQLRIGKGRDGKYHIAGTGL